MNWSDLWYKLSIFLYQKWVYWALLAGLLTMGLIFVAGWFAE